MAEDIAPPKSLDHMAPTLGPSVLHRRFLEVLPGASVQGGDIEQKPIEVDLAPPLPPRIRLYLYNATTPVGGRTLGECKAQLLVPGQVAGQRGNFDWGGGRSVLLVGYNHEYDVFVLWDAGLHRDFPYSKNVQITPETLIRAGAGQLSEQVRRLRPVRGMQVEEVVVAVPASSLDRGIRRRSELTRRRLADLSYA
jgi:hypothetical protein